jgi:glycosyltransferase involved in cell wall biosynthesis
MSRPAVSIIINNYNYGRFIAQAIESALNQTVGETEVIIVDDGSTDDSRDVIAHYAKDAAVILKENGGQASAFNRGFEASRGDVIIFLDSDDALFPTAAERAIEGFHSDDRIVKVHWPLLEINEAGERTGKTIPAMALPHGDHRDYFIREGPWSLATPPTSGNAWSRRFLQGIGPVPQTDYRICADAFLIALAPVSGLLCALEEPLGLYRLHRQNHYYAKPFVEALRKERWVFK